MVNEILIVVIVLLMIWLGFVSFFLFKSIFHYQNLTKNVKQKNLESVLQDLVNSLEDSKKDIEKLIYRCDTIEKQQVFHIQKIGLLRFNPFKDTGGDQSFILSLTDAENSGVVITGLYARSGVRWYVKSVEKGVGVEYELSGEEKKALKDIRDIKNAKKIS